MIVTPSISYFSSYSFLNHSKSFFIIGVLGSLDGYMNIVLEQTEEYVNGQVWVKFSGPSKCDNSLWEKFAGKISHRNMNI